MGVHDELVRNRADLRGERVVARRDERIREAREHARPVVVHVGRLAVKEFGCPSDDATERDDQRLVAEAHAEHRQFATGAGTDQLDARAGAFRRTRSR